MTEYPGRRKTPLADPTDTPTSDPVPTGEDVVNQYRHRHETPRQYEKPENGSKSVDRDQRSE